MANDDTNTTCYAVERLDADLRPDSEDPVSVHETEAEARRAAAEYRGAYGAAVRRLADGALDLGGGWRAEYDADTQTWVCGA